MHIWPAVDFQRIQHTAPGPHSRAHMGIQGILEIPGDCESGNWDSSLGSPLHMLCHQLLQGACWKSAVCPISLRHC